MTRNGGRRAGYCDDRASIFESPDKGWGWLVKHGFTIIETNHPYELVKYLEGGMVAPTLAVRHHKRENWYNIV